MHNQRIAGQILRKVAAAYNIDLQSFPDLFPQQFRNLFPANIAIKRVVRARLCNQHAILLRQPIHLLRPLTERADVALIARHQNGKRG